MKRGRKGGRYVPIREEGEGDREWHVVDTQWNRISLCHWVLMNRSRGEVREIRGEEERERISNRDLEM